MKRFVMLALVAMPLASCQTQDRSANQTVGYQRVCQNIGTKRPPHCFYAKQGRMVPAPVEVVDTRPRVQINNDPNFWFRSADALNRAAWSGVDPNRPVITECQQFGARVVCTTH